MSAAPTTPDETIPPSQEVPQTDPVPQITLPAGSALGLPPLATPRVNYDKPEERGSWSVGNGKGGQSTTLWNQALQMKWDMHIKRDALAYKRNTEEVKIREFIGDEPRPHYEMTPDQRDAYTSYKGCGTKIKGISKGKGKLNCCMRQFQKDITAESDTTEDNIRDDLKKAMQRAKFPDFKNIEISGVELHWHETEGVSHENVEEHKFHVRGTQSFMENARPQG